MGERTSDRIPLLLLPGLLCDAALWAPQMASLSDMAECRVVEWGEADSMPGMAAAALEHAPPRFALAGLSMGGYVAQQIMREAPERVDRLALLDTSARADTPEQRERRLALLQLAKRGRFKGVTPRLLPLLIHPSRLQETALTEIVMGMAERVGRDAFLRQQTAIMGRQDFRPDLPKVTCPTLVLCGRQDALTPLDRHEEIAGLVPDAELVVIEDCGHLSSLERPEAVNAAMRRWLAR